MTGFQGLDPFAVEQLARQLHSHARGLAAIQRQISSLISHASTYWQGPEMRHFTDDWQRHHLRATQVASDALEGLGRSARNNAAEQRRASGGTHGDGQARGMDAGGPVGFAETPLLPLCRDVRPREFLELASGSYHDAKPITVDGITWNPVGPAELRKLGIEPRDMLDDASGFSATLYRGEGGTYVLAYAGTNPTDHDGDLLDDVVGASPAALSRQTQHAVALALTLDKTIGDDLVFTGHSLGGRLAALASVATDRTATTFNAAGVSDSEFFYALEAGGKDGHLTPNVLKSTLAPFSEGIDLYRDERRALQSQVTAYYGSRDLLTEVQAATAAPNAVGRQVRVTSDALSPITAHNLDDLRKNLPR